MKIVSQAPLRISLFGGGSDIDPYASQFGGICLNFAINIYQKITLHKLERLTKEDNPKFFQAFRDAFNYTGGIVHEYDNGIESGLGSSASLAVALVAGLSRFKGENLSQEEIAQKAWDIEVNKIGLFGGKQDQLVATHGGVNVMEIGKEILVIPLDEKFINPILPSLVLFNSGIKRRSSKIQEAMKDLTPERAFYLTYLKNMVEKSIPIIASGDFKAVGELLDESWNIKKLSNDQISNTEIDNLYEKGKSLGAYGGKICGSGGGGHILFVVDPFKRDQFIKDIGLKHIDFKIDWNGVKTEVVK